MNPVHPLRQRGFDANIIVTGSYMIKNDVFFLEKLGIITYQSDLTLVTTKYTGSNKLMVGSYDPSLPTETSGSLAIYTVPPVNGDLVLDKSFNGFGRIKNSSWRVCI